MIKHLSISIILLIGIINQQTVSAKTGSICPYSADVCQQIIDLAKAIKDNTKINYSSTGVNITPRTDCCIKTSGADGIDKLHFDVNETIYFGMQDGTEQQWGYLGKKGPPEYLGPGRFNYTLGFSTEGTYLDESCHAKLGIQTNPTNGSNLFYWVDQDVDCDNYQEYYGGNPNGNLSGFGGYYSYSTPGLKVITSIALPYYFTNKKFTVPMTFKIITVGDEYKPLNSVDYSWLIPALYPLNN